MMDGIVAELSAFNNSFDIPFGIRHSDFVILLSCGIVIFQR